MSHAILVSIDIGIVNFALGIAKYYGQIRPLEIISLELFSCLQGKKKVTWEDRTNNLIDFMIQQFDHVWELKEQDPEIKAVYIICEQQLPNAKSNCRVAAIVQATAITYMRMKGSIYFSFDFLHPLQKFPHGIPSDFPSKSKGYGYPHHDLKAYSCQITTQHLKAYGPDYDYWFTHIFDVHADKSDDLSDIFLQMLVIQKQLLEKDGFDPFLFLQPMIPYEKGKAKKVKRTKSMKRVKRVKRITAAPSIILSDEQYGDVFFVSNNNK